MDVSDRQTDKQIHILKGRLLDRQIDGSLDRQIDKSLNRQTFKKIVRYAIKKTLN